MACLLSFISQLIIIAQHIKKKKIKGKLQMFWNETSNQREPHGNAKIKPMIICKLV